MKEQKSELVKYKEKNNVTIIETKTDELNLNYGGFTLNVDIPKFINNVKKFSSNRKAKQRKLQEEE